MSNMTETKDPTVITCNCAVCNGLSARIGGNGSRMNRTKIHNLVRIAHSPLANSGSAKRFGPWPV